MNVYCRTFDILGALKNSVLKAETRETLKSRLTNFDSAISFMLYEFAL